MGSGPIWQSKKSVQHCRVTALALVQLDCLVPAIEEKDGGRGQLVSDAEDKSYRVSVILLDPHSNMQYAALA